MSIARLKLVKIVKMIFFNVVVDDAISVVASEITSKPRKQRGKNKVRHSEFWEQGFNNSTIQQFIGMTKSLSSV